METTKVEFNSPIFATTEELSKNIENPNIRIIDATSSIKDDLTEQVQKQHIPNACYWDVKKVCSEWSNLPSTEHFITFCESNGISNDS